MSYEYCISLTDNKKGTLSCDTFAKTYNPCLTKGKIIDEPRLVGAGQWWGAALYRIFTQLKYEKQGKTEKLLYTRGVWGHKLTKCNVISLIGT